MDVLGQPAVRGGLLAALVLMQEQRVESEALVVPRLLGTLISLGKALALGLAQYHDHLSHP
jgi:hypothetical protein